jgi:acyl-CoA thioester hydrolase
MPPFLHQLRVRYGECDPQGIVFNANYLLYFDVAFTELWRAGIGPWDEMTTRGYDAVVGEARLTFRAPARFDDVIVLELTAARLGRSSITTAVRILHGDEVLVEGELRHVVVSTDTWKPVDMPEWIRSGLERFSADPEAAARPHA